MRYAMRAPAALLFLLPTLLLAGCGPAAAGPGDRTPAAGPSSQAGKPEDSPAPDQVVIDNFTFRPAKLTVKAGTKVTWVNHDDVPHTATSSAKPRAFNSGTLDTDEQFSFTFKTPGTYEYFCTLHPRMTGQIIVK